MYTRGILLPLSEEEYNIEDTYNIYSQCIIAVLPRISGRQCCLGYYEVCRNSSKCKIG